MQTKSKIMSSGLSEKPIMLLLLKLRLFEPIQGCFQENYILLKLLPLSTPALFRASLLTLIKNVLSKMIFEEGQKVFEENIQARKIPAGVQLSIKKGEICCSVQ